MLYVYISFYEQGTEHHYCDGIVKSEVLPDLQVDLEQIFVI